MHVVFRESHGLEESETPTDLGQTPADMVVLSFSDSDLGAFAAGWHRAEGGLPSLRLANLVALKHPLSVDVYCEQTLAEAKAILVRVIGGESYWPYGLASLQDLARRNNIALAVLPADGRADERLTALSTVANETLTRLKTLCDAGGAVAAQAALATLAKAAKLPVGDVAEAVDLPQAGWYDPDRGATSRPDAADVVVTFYRSYLVSADLEPIDALIRDFRKRGYRAAGLFAPSLKGPSAAWVSEELSQIAPLAVVNATAFSAKGDDGRSPLDAAGCPVFQVALSTARRKEWLVADRGLSPADLAMHVVLPEVDGRIFAGVISFKAPTKRDADLEYSRFVHRADAGRIAAALDRIEGWIKLSQTPAKDKKLAIILSIYPGRADQLAHAVGLDALASAQALLTRLRVGGIKTAPVDDLGKRLMDAKIKWPLDQYRAQFSADLEPFLSLSQAWGAPSDDPLLEDGAFKFSAIQSGNVILALQPERGDVLTRDDDYHDLARTPRHSYVAFYLWLKALGVDAIIHMGAHGTLEWLPGKAVALSDSCWPEVLTSAPVIYPFIVNDPGEAAQAKRRIGAVTLGHMPPPMREGSLPEGFEHLEQLLDEYSTADGIDPKRRERLIARILEEAKGRGLEEDLGIPQGASAADAITRIDRFVCDIKESQFGDGLHIYGDAAGEAEGLMAAIEGKFVAAGPAGSPYRGRDDVCPTGRNLFSVDPRAVPSRAAYTQGVKLAEELLRRHLQDHGDWPKGLVIDLWGSATMRTAGEEFAMALHLAGLAPTWNDGSARVSGFEILPLAVLGRPRIDVTIRTSGLFRDVFAGLGQIFEAGSAALARRDEDPSDNPYLSRSPRVFGPKPGQYGMAMSEAMETYSDEGRDAAGEAWLKASEWAIDANGAAYRDRAALEARVLKSDGFVHVQDLAESDLLLASDYAAHEGGFAAAVQSLGGNKSSLYHLDTTNPDAPRARALTEEIARVVRGRAANPAWADGMMRHGFRGAAEITATLDHLAAFAHLTREVPAHLFDLYYEATLGRDDLVEFMRAANPAALSALQARFDAVYQAGLWETRRNWIASALEGDDV
ncbi:cobaltochelatase subunit CobN [Albirhodobacter sp. R86504]|uniref:cobaltochelatase subunit CobN n=1 Tax=Albirhodobacter sp. R86504 TaxID=3093848 RepID=UPI00367030A3